MNLYEKILHESKQVDRYWITKTNYNLTGEEISFGKYSLHVEENFETALIQNFPPHSLFIVDEKLDLKNILKNKNVLFLEADESKTKNIDFIESVIHAHGEMFVGKTIVAVGGGVVLDTALSIASILNLKIILVPTTIIAMSDSATGGKARANKIKNIDGKEIFLKHFYRKYYTPLSVVICKNFLETIPNRSILFSSAEIIKHAFFQSEELLSYLLSSDFDPFENKDSLLKAILWAQDLKRVCFETDPQETENGGKRIIREGHVYADKVEKESGFKISHGEAVYLGIKHDLENESNKFRFEKFLELENKLKVQ